MALYDTYLKVQDEVLQRLGWSGTARRNLVKDWINKGGYRIYKDWRHAPWRKKFGSFLTFAPYSTGTVSSSGATITGVGTTFTAAHVGRKFAQALGSPYFEVATRTDGTEITIDQSWPFTALSGSTYIIYKDVFSLASDCQTLLRDQVTLHDSNGHKMGSLSVVQGLEDTDLPTGTGRPEDLILREPDSSGNVQVQVWPRVPDQVYVIRYGYIFGWTELSDNTDVPAIPSRHGELLVLAACATAGQHPEFRGSNLLSNFTALYQDELRLAKDDTRGSPNAIPASTYDGRQGSKSRYPFPFPLPNS
ncbi:MAG: hypothetical protein ACPHCN_08395 [Mycobacterium sp.]